MAKQLISSARQWLPFFITALLSGLAGQAQPANANWCFGPGLGLSFQAGSAQIVSSSVPQVNKANSTLSDEQGNLLLYTDGESVWDRHHVALPNACAVCGTGLSLNGNPNINALLIRKPASADSVYVFTLDVPALPDRTYTGLRYSVVDLSLRSGQGDVRPAAKNMLLQPAGPNCLLTEKLAAVRHANRRDVWLVVHESQTSRFYSYLLGPSGLHTTPIVSQVGSKHTDYTGPMKFSRDGRMLAVNQVIVGIELFDFDLTTGRVSNPQALPSQNEAWNFGIEFSPDNSKLYVQRLTISSMVRQYNLRAGNLAAIIRSAVDLPLQSTPTVNYIGHLELANDGKIYLSQSYASPFLGVVNRPNAAGQGCNFRESAVSLGGRSGSMGLQNIVRELPSPSANIIASSACLGSTTRFHATAESAADTSDIIFTWRFGDPGSGAADSATGASAAHRYARAGSYLAVVRAQLPDGTVLLGQQQIIVAAPPVVAFAPPVVESCQVPGVLLQLNAQPAGIRYRWPDNSTGSSLRVYTPGTYWAEVTDSLGCTTRATTEVALVSCLIPSIITPNGDPLNQTFTLRGLNAPDWRIRIYNRWGREIFAQARYDNSWAAEDQPNGLYYYLLTNAQTGQQFKGWVEVAR